MNDPAHHRQFIEKLQKHWRDAGGPLSLTSFLRECRPTIAPLLRKNVSWHWLAPRIEAVFDKPMSEIEEDLPAIGPRKKTMIELYSRTTRRENQDPPVEEANDDAPEMTDSGSEKDGPGGDALSNVQVDIPPVLSGATSIPNRRARIRQSGALRQNLEKKDVLS